ncbi:MAG: 16S rRNA (adenine(1518)-N(6)/adenine(1519)-N(6))-dimethyltransferase RsmA [bacterium]
MSNLYSPNHLKQLCREYKLTPSKRYGQNFLISSKPIQEMISSAMLSKKDTVVEVGPGFGVLTLELIKKAGVVKAYEIEKKIQPYWQENQQPNLEITWGNVLKSFKFNGKYKVVANLPYQITSSIIRGFLESDHQPELMVMMMQKEVAERICAKPGKMSLLSVSVQYYAEPEIVMKVPRTCFWPAPKVDSAVIKLKIKTSKKSVCAKVFFSIAKAGFASPRKLLLNNLACVFKDKEMLLRTFQNIGIPDKARAQELNLDQWIKLASKLEKGFCF